MISGIVTIILMLAFFAVIAWAWSDRRKEEFEHLANLPFKDDIKLTKDKGDKDGND